HVAVGLRRVIVIAARTVRDDLPILIESLNSYGGKLGYVDVAGKVGDDPGGGDVEAERVPLTGPADPLVAVRAMRRQRVRPIRPGSGTALPLRPVPQHRRTRRSAAIT